MLFLKLKSCYFEYGKLYKNTKLIFITIILTENKENSKIKI